MKKLAVIICVLVVVLGSLFIWNSYQKSDSVDLRVACNLTITGDFGLYGESIQKGILMAQEDLNDSAIANNVKVVYDFIDNASDTKNAVTIYKRQEMTGFDIYMSGITPQSAAIITPNGFPVPSAATTHSSGIQLCIKAPIPTPTMT